MESLYRLDEKQWSFSRAASEIRLISPGFSDRSADYKLAMKAKEHLEMGGSGPFDYQKKGKDFPCLSGKWKLRDATREEYRRFQIGSLFYKRDFPQPGVQVLKIEPDSLIHSLSLQLQRYFPCLARAPTARIRLELPYTPGESEILKQKLFSDPFTRLASQALQRHETPFVSEKECAGSYHYALENGTLSLAHRDLGASPLGKMSALLAYRDQIRRSFEWRTIRCTEEGLRSDLASYPEAFDTKRPRSREEQYLGYLKETFGIDFDAMVKKGEPLLPDHVYKCNIAANQIEMAYLESFYARLDACLKQALKNGGAQPLSTIHHFFTLFKELGIAERFSLKEIEGIYRSFSKHSQVKTAASLAAFLDSIELLPFLKRNLFGEAVRCLTPEAFHKVMEMLCDFSVNPEPFFTGRKITHLAICGYKTMGNRNVFDPCRNLSELLHIYPALRKGSRESHNELLAHVVAKKALYQSYPWKFAVGETEWRVGRLIPFGDEGALSRWYYVDGYLNDGSGDINYVLIPACKGYLEAGCPKKRECVAHEKRLPLIKLYRSTASDKEAESSTESLLADLNPKRVGSLDFSRGDQYERPYFQKCTMPVWVGYLVAGNVEKAAACFLEASRLRSREEIGAYGKEENLVRFLAWQKKGTHRNAAALFDSFKRKVGEERVRHFFTRTAAGSEWAKENKVAQDIYFIGHSLGGALAQASLHHFGPLGERIPLVGCNFHCFPFQPPGGVTDEEAEQFLEFGRKHKDLIQALGQRWKIDYLFEYQDFVPQGGPQWLGVSQDPARDEKWLEVRGTIFTPLSTAKSQEMTTLATHGRRFHGTVPENEYRSEPLSPEELFTFKTSYWLPDPLRKKFGYAISIPRLTEDLRSGFASRVLFSVLWVQKKWNDWKGNTSRPDSDRSGVSFVAIGKPDHATEEERGTSP